MGLSRSFQMRGVEKTRRLQIRSEFFNALNHTNFGWPAASTFTGPRQPSPQPRPHVLSRSAHVSEF